MDLNAVPQDAGYKLRESGNRQIAPKAPQFTCILFKGWVLSFKRPSNTLVDHPASGFPDRGREEPLARFPPPSEPYRRISRIRLSS